MGFSWSLYFAQVANENLMMKVPSLVGSVPITDRGPPVVFEEVEDAAVRHYVYVDNLGVVSPHRGVVKASLEEVGFSSMTVAWFCALVRFNTSTSRHLEFRCEVI